MIDERLNFMKYVAKHSGRIILKYMKGGFKSEKKEAFGRVSDVTDADKAVDEFVKEEFSRKFPDDGLLTEEGQDNLERLNKKYTWIWDGLDGTTEFIEGLNNFCVLGADVEDGVPVRGVVYDPIKDRLFFAKKGRGAFLTEKRDTTKLDSLNPTIWDDMFVGYVKYFKGKKYDRLFRLLEVPPESLIPCGSMGIKMMQVALQQTHLTLGYSREIKEWDVAAGHIILEEMGISVTDIYGNSLKYNKKVPKMDKGFLVAHPDIKEEVLDKLKQAYKEIKI